MGVGDFGTPVAAGFFVATGETTATICVGTGPIIVGVSVGSAVTAGVGEKFAWIVKVGRGVLVSVAVGLEKARKSVTLPASQASKTSPRTTMFSNSIARCLLNGSSPWGDSRVLYVGKLEQANSR